MCKSDSSLSRDLFAVLALISFVAATGVVSLSICSGSASERGIVETIVSAMVSMTSGGGVPLEEALKEKYDLKLKLEKFKESSKNLTKLINSQISVKDKIGLGFDSHVNESEVLDNVVDSHECNQVNDRFKKSEGYHAVLPPFIGNFKPARANLSFAGLDDSLYKSKVSETITSVPNVETTVTKTSKDSLEKPKTVRFSAPIIEDWESDSEDENVFEPKEVKKTVKSSFEKIEFVNARNSTVEKPRKFSQNPRDNKRNRNSFEFTKKACFVCGSFNHLIKDCDFHDKKMVQKPVLNNVKKGTGQREVRQVWNNAMRVNHQNFSNSRRDFAPTAVLTKSGIVPISAARQSSSRAASPTIDVRPINTATPKPFVNVARPRPNAFHKSHSPSRTPFNQQTTLKNRNLNDKVNTAKVNSVNTAKGNKVTSAVGEQGINAVKSSACWIWRPKGNVIDHISKDSGSYMPKRFDYGNPQYALQDQGIFDSGCSRHMTGNKFYLSDYQDIDGGFVAFGGSSKGGKITGKGKIRTGKLDFEDVYFVKELKFNIFSVSQMCDKKNSVLFTETECLVLSPDFKLLDESQVLLKIPRQNNMYSFDLKNVVPSGDLTCLFAKATIDESNLWHRRLGHINFKKMKKLMRGNLVRGLPSKIFENDHTCVACQKRKQHKASFSVRSINRKCYYLVVTDDFSRFSWVFLLATKDETPEILKNFITSIENQSDYKVKTFRSDNGTEFKNKIMNEFCEIKGIRREFSVARNPQQNGVVERKNRTLIEAARTMLSSRDEIAKDAGKKNGVEDPTKEDDINGLGEATNTNRLNTVSSPVNTVSSSFTTVDPGRARYQRNKFESVFGQDKDANSTYRMLTPVSAVESSYENISGSTPVNVATPSNADYPTDPLMHDLEDIADLQDTGIFGNAYDNEDVYVDDIIFGSTKKSLCIEFESLMHKKFQMRSMGELTFFLRLQVKQKDNGIFISQDKYVTDILKKFDFSSVKTTSTPLETNKALIKDEEVEDVDVHLYRSMIRSLMYLTTSRPDIMLAVCARFQVTLKTSHFHDVKRIFRYLKGQPKLGLWYPRDSPFDLEAFSDSDYA
ncbi:ribonuclease H-like domain-containing protein [Tanacetum coccineum]|uniref:Ribonuclease H-like domain-containing protein n=1 Tax=Tanacetum coccineum TaxID=301880 RepID=A0ABQ5HGC2_9ASTR